MISLDECRQLIDEGETVSEKEVKEIRDTLYQLAHVVLESYSKQEQLQSAVETGDSACITAKLE